MRTSTVILAAIALAVFGAAPRSAIAASAPVLGLTSGGTGGHDAASARAGINAAARGDNTDITSLLGLTTPVPLSEGGTNGHDALSARLGIGAAARGDNTDINSLASLRGTFGMIAPAIINTGPGAVILGAPQGTGGANITAGIVPLAGYPGAGCKIGDRIGVATHNDVQANLVGDISALQTTITVDSDDGFPQSTSDPFVPIYVLIDSEWMEVLDGYGTTTWTVARGQKLTTAAIHHDGAVVDWLPAGTLEGPAVFQVDSLTSAGPPITLTGTFSGTHMTISAATGPVLTDGSMYIGTGNFFIQPLQSPGIAIIGQESGVPNGAPGVYTISSPLTVANSFQFSAGGSPATIEMLYGGAYSLLPYLTPAAMGPSGYKLNKCAGTNVTLTGGGTPSAASYDAIQILGLARQPGGHFQIKATGYASLLIGSNDIKATDAAIFILGVSGRNDANKVIYYNSIQYVIGNAHKGSETGRVQFGGYVDGHNQQEAVLGKGLTVGSTLTVPVYNADGPGLGWISAVNGYALGANAPVGNGYTYWLDASANATLNTVTTNKQCATTGVFTPLCTAANIEADRGVTPLSGTLTFTPSSSTISWNGGALAANEPISLSVSGGSLPPEFSTTTTYFVYGFPTTNTLKLATSALGPAIIPSTAGTGTATGTVLLNGPFAPLRITSKDGSKRRSGLVGAQGGVELDLVKSGPDDLADDVMADLVGREENGASTDGPTSIWRGLRIRPESNQNNATGPVEIVRALEVTSAASYPGSSIDYALISDSARTGLYLSSASQTSVTTAAQVSGDTALTFSNAYPTASAISGVKTGDLICEQLNCVSPVNIPAGTTVAAVHNNGASTTLTPSNPIGSGGIALGQTIYTYHVFTDGVNLSGNYSDAVLKLGSQYGTHEFTLLNGATFGNAVGGQMGLGNINLAGGLYLNGQPLNQQISVNVPSSPGVSVTTNTPTIIASFTLTPGNWDLTGNVVLKPSATLVLSNISVAIGWGTTYCGGTPLVPPPPNFGAYASFLGPAVTNPNNFTIPTGRIHLTTNTSEAACIVAQGTFSGSGATLAAGGYLSAERVMQ